MKIVVMIETGEVTTITTIAIIIDLQSLEKYLL